MPNVCVKWDDARLTGFKVFKWNERLTRNNIPEGEGLFVFRRDDGTVKRVFRFNLRTMVEWTPDPSTGRFLPRQDGHAFSVVFTKSRLFYEPDPLVNELGSFVRAFFEFSSETVNSPNSPRLVFVLDFSCNPVLDLVDALLLLNEDEQEDTALDMYLSDVTDVDDDNDDAVAGEVVNSGEGAGEAAGNAADVEADYTDEMEEIVAHLRVFRGVKRTYPIVPLSQGERAGLVQVDMPVVELLEETAPVECVVCQSEMEAEDAVLKTKCGRMLHKTCSLSWLTPNVKCPICQSCTATLL